MTANLQTPRRSFRPALTRGVAALGVAVALLLVASSIALIAFAQVLPALLALGAAAMVAAVSGPVLWMKLPDEKGRHRVQ